MVSTTYLWSQLLCTAVMQGLIAPVACRHGEPLVHIVDDDGSFRAAIERLLKRAGYEVATYASAEHLLERLPSDRAASSSMYGYQE
jgi:hypothetical protein